MAGNQYIAALDPIDYANWHVSPERKMKLLARNRTIKKLYEEGRSQKEIVIAMEMNPHTVRLILKALKRAGRLKPRPTSFPVDPPLDLPPDIKDARDEAIAYLRNLSLPIPAIAGVMKLSPNYVAKILVRWQEDHPGVTAGGEKLTKAMREIWRGER